MENDLKNLNIASLRTMHATLKKTRDSVKNIKELRTASMNDPKVKNNAGANTKNTKNDNMNLASLDVDARKVKIAENIKKDGFANALAKAMNK